MRLDHVATVRQGIVTSGHGAGARPGAWEVREVSLGDISDDRLTGEGVELRLDLSPRTERHLLQPYDVLVTARSTVVKAALVPASLSRAVANSTLAVVRPRDPEIGAYLWWFFTSRYGRAVVEAQMVGSTVKLLRAGALEEIDVPVPSARELHRIADLVEASEAAYAAAMKVAGIRREQLRDALIEDMVARAADGQRQRERHGTD